MTSTHSTYISDTENVFSQKTMSNNLNATCDWICNNV